MKSKLSKYALGLMMGMGLMGMNTTAQAADAVSMFADIGVQSQYIWRGAAQGTGQGSIQGDAGIEHESGASANVWFATGVGADEIEYDITLDYSGEAGDIGYSVGFIAYKFVNDSTLDANEFYIGASFDIASVTAYIGDGYNYIEAGVGTTVGDMFDVSLAAGVNLPDTGSSTNHYTLGASKDFDNITANVTVGKAGSLDAEFAAGVNYAF